MSHITITTVDPLSLSSALRSAGIAFALFEVPAKSRCCLSNLDGFITMPFHRALFTYYPASPSLVHILSPRG
jgi:hypothetical protein